MFSITKNWVGRRTRKTITLVFPTKFFELYRQRRANCSCLFYYPDLRKKSNCYTLKKYENGTTANRPDVNTCRHEIESRRQRMKKSSDEMPIKRRAGMSNRQCKYHPYRRVFCKMLHMYKLMCQYYFVIIARSFIACRHCRSTRPLKCLDS